MKGISKIVFVCLSLSVANAFSQHITMSLPSRDSVMITADTYEVNPDYPYVLMLHQDEYSRGEYMEIAPQVNTLGFNCLAIDMRSGNTVHNIRNKTAAMARKKNLPTTYLDAEPDILAAIDYLKTLTTKPIIIWGSSYSASLALKIAASHPQVKAALAFSPGEYFDGLTVADSLKTLAKPVFIASSREEAESVKELMKGTAQKNVTYFVPTQPGDHGSKALWTESLDHNEYWLEVRKFLKTQK